MAAEAQMKGNDNDNEGLYEYESKNTQFHDMCIAEDDYYRRKQENKKSLLSLHNNTLTSIGVQDDNISYDTRRGILLECLVMRDKSLMHKCISAFYPASAGNLGTNIDLPCEAIVLTVGITGAPYCSNFSPQLYELRKRLDGFRGFSMESKNSNRRRDLETVLLSLLMDDESLKTRSGNHIDINAAQ